MKKKKIKFNNNKINILLFNKNKHIKIYLN